MHGIDIIYMPNRLYHRLIYTQFPVIIYQDIGVYMVQTCFDIYNCIVRLTMLKLGNNIVPQ